MVKCAPRLGVFVLAAVLIFAFTLNGCTSKRSEFVRVKSSAVYTTSNEMAEITKTPRYSNMVSQIKSVALSAPSSCANQPASSATGSAESKGSIVMTRCGVEMSEIERALVLQGFTVYSWNLVNNLIIANKTNTTAVAKQLGAQVLFQVNSLERVNITPERDVRIERSFFGSNTFGESLNPLKLDEQRINEIKAVTVADEQKQLELTKYLGAMLDINAVDSETGQTIWFYRWSKHEDTSKITFASFLLQCWDNWGCRQEVEPSRDSQQNLPEKRDTKPEKNSTEVETFSAGARSASVQDVIYFNLLRDVTADFAKRFASGQ